MSLLYPHRESSLRSPSRRRPTGFRAIFFLQEIALSDAGVPPLFHCFVRPAPAATGRGRPVACLPRAARDPSAGPRSRAFRRASGRSRPFGGVGLGAGSADAVPGRRGDNDDEYCNAPPATAGPEKTGDNDAARMLRRRLRRPAWPANRRPLPRPDLAATPAKRDRPPYFPRRGLREDRACAWPRSAARGHLQIRTPRPPLRARRPPASG